MQPHPKRQAGMPRVAKIGGTGPHNAPTANWAVQLSLHKPWSLPCKRRPSGTVAVPDSSSQSHKVTERFGLAAAGTAAAGPCSWGWLLNLI